MTNFQSFPPASNEDSGNPRMLPKITSHPRSVFRHVNSCNRKKSSRSSMPSCSNSICRTSRIRFPWLSSCRACSMIRSVSTPLSCTEIDGLAASSPTLISPTSAAQERHRLSTSAPSLPGTGVLIVPWFSAAKRFALRPLRDSTPGTSAESKSVFIRRSSVRNATRDRSSAGNPSISSFDIPCCFSNNGSNFR